VSRVVEIPAVVPLRLIRAGRDAAPAARPRWRLSYAYDRSAHAVAGLHTDLDRQPLARLRIVGTPPSWVRTILVARGDLPVFELDSWVDPIGRTTSAGEVLAAMARYWGGLGLVIDLHSAGLVVPMGSARVDLCVDAPATGVGVHAELR